MRRHVDPETPPEADAQALELQKVLKVLLPIRKQRLNRSERQQRQQEQKLQQCQQDHQDGIRLLDGKSKRYRQTAAEFLPQHQGKNQPLDRLRGALNDEQQQRDEMQKQQQQLVVLESATQQQQHCVEESISMVKRCQRDVEKIEYLLKNSEAEQAQ